MERIIVIGCSGAGKSTLSRQLSEKLNLPLIHLDALFWRDHWKECPREEFDALLEAELKKPKWIIDGNYNRTLPLRLAHCDTVLYLDYSLSTCLRSVCKRVVTGYGKTRPDMGPNCPERVDFGFLLFILRFNHENRARYYRMMEEEKAKGENVIILRSRQDADRLLHSL